MKIFFIDANSRLNEVKTEGKTSLTKDMVGNEFQQQNAGKTWTAFKSSNSGIFGNMVVAEDSQAALGLVASAGMTVTLNEGKESGAPPPPTVKVAGVFRAGATSAVINGYINEAASAAATAQSVTLASARTSIEAWMKQPAVEAHHLKLFFTLAINAVGNIKKKWASAYAEPLKQLGSLPEMFCGNGGVFKAWLYVGYDILRHMSQDPNKGNWPEWLQLAYANRDKACPGGNIMNARMLQPGSASRKKVEDKNAAISAAQSAFAAWQPSSTIPYVKTLVAGDIAKVTTVNFGTINGYDESLDQRAERT